MAWTFHLDPLLLLQEPSTLNRLVRLAAHDFIHDELEKAEKEAARKRRH